MSTTDQRSRLTRGGLAALLLGAVALLGGLTGDALAACPSSASSTPFARFGDSSPYTLAPGGSFETAGTGWTFRGASVVTGNESYGAVPGTHALSIPGGASAASPWICIDSEHPTFRFFARRATGVSPLLASLRWTNVLGMTIETQAGTVTDIGAWSPSPVMMLGDSVALWLPGGTLRTQLVFRAPSGSSWTIDDVYIDPYRR